MSDAPPNEFNYLTQLLKAAGDDLRLEVLRVLAKDSFGVLELSHLFDTKQSGMSHHLKVLSNAKLVTTRKEGNSIFYRRMPISTEDEFAPLKSAVLDAVDKITPSQTTMNNLSKIYSQRSATSRSFFSDNIEKFKQQQDLIAAFDVYGDHVKDILENAKHPSYEVALEVGPGAGEFLETLCEKFAHTTAIDTSQKMLSECKSRCDEKGYSNIDFVHGDTQYCRQIKNSVDSAVINMVLHHTPSPQQIFEDVSAALKPNGCIIICDLCEHNQDWTREACGDLWLGFDPEDLTRWANKCNLNEGQSVYFALRNGFQIQIREFIKTANV